MCVSPVITLTDIKLCHVSSLNLGYVTISTTDLILFGGTTGHPNVDTFTYTGSGRSSGTITFQSDCTDFDETYTTDTCGTVISTAIDHLKLVLFIV